MTSQKVQIIFLVCLLIAAGQISISLYLPSLPAIAEALGGDPRMSQLTLALFLLGFASSQLVYGPLSDVLGRQKLILIGLAIFIVGSAVCALSTKMEGLFIGRLIQGLGIGAGSVLARAVLRDVFTGPQFSKAMSYVAVSIALMPFLGPVIGGYIQDWVGWRGNFAGLLILGSVTLLLQWRFLPETNPVKREQRAQISARNILRDFAWFLKNRNYMAYAACAILGFGCMIALMSSIPFFYQEYLGLSATTHGWLSGAKALAFLIGAGLSGRLASYRGVQFPVGLGLSFLLAGSAVFCMVAIFMDLSIFAILLPGMIMMLGVGMLFPNALAGALMPFPEKAGTAAALLGFLQMLISGAVSAVVAILPEVTLFPVAIVLLVMSLFAYTIFFRFVPTLKLESITTSRFDP